MTLIRRPGIVLAVALLVGVTACSSSKNDTSTADTTKATSASTTTAGGSSTAATVKVADNAKFGKLLVGPDGHTLYLFEKDQGTTTACTGGCVANWPALTAANPYAGDGVEASKLSTANGEAANQVVYNGHLLYYFAGDKAAGDVNGAGIPSWYPVNPSGNKIDND